MRLRYLQIKNLPPLDDLAIPFARERGLYRSCSIHFIVGVNGSGKSQLLRALADCILSLEGLSIPSYLVCLAYDLGSGDSARTIYVQNLTNNVAEAVLVEFDTILPDKIDWQELQGVSWNVDSAYPFPVKNIYKGDQLPGGGSIGSCLPSVVLAYTSGIADTWEKIFSSHYTTSDITAASSDGVDYTQERPQGWTDAKEAKSRSQEAPTGGYRSGVATWETSLMSIGAFVSAYELELALCAVALWQLADEFSNQIPSIEAEASFMSLIDDSIVSGRRMAGLRGIFNEVDWLWPVTISLRIAYNPDQLVRQQADKLKELHGIATAIVKDPAPGHCRSLNFDLRKPIQLDNVDTTTASALLKILGGENPTPFKVFKLLADWRRDGLLEDITIALRKRNVDDLILYDWLSDGERAFLGRMALFHLLQGQDGKGQEDALILLDEPETHFNDVWKREIVDMIDDSMRRFANEIIISTHSSIALSDVFAEEIMLLRKSKSTGKVELAKIVTPTFGADPSEIMVEVFDASDSIGQRALEYLEGQLDRKWKKEDLEQLKRLIRRVGAGYYRSELRRILREIDVIQD